MAGSGRMEAVGALALHDQHNGIPFPDHKVRRVVSSVGEPEGDALIFNVNL